MVLGVVEVNNEDSEGEILQAAKRQKVRESGGTKIANATSINRHEVIDLIKGD